MALKTFADLSVDSRIENFSRVKEWLQRIFDETGCTGKPCKQVFIAVDEVYTNISNYAYEGVGQVLLKSTYETEEKILKIILIDSGDEYNPLEASDPDIAQRVKDKTVGGLGIFLVKKMVDSLEYSRVENRNQLVISKKM